MAIAPIGSAPLPATPRSRRARLLVSGAAVAAGAGCLLAIGDPIQARVAGIAAFCLALWLGEAAPGFVPTLLLLALLPLVLGGLDPGFRLPQVCAWAADPVLALFLGGFALGVGAQRFGLDAAMAALAVRWSGGRRLRLLALVMGATTFLSMWMSNIAASAMMIAAVRPLLRSQAHGDRFRTALLAGIAMAATLGGMATPIGTGPNAIAMAALEGTHPLSFVAWMAFALPLTVLLLVAMVGFLAWRHGAGGRLEAPSPPPPLHPGAGRMLAVGAAMIAAWLTEPLHGVSAPGVALLGTAVLFGTGMLGREDLGRIDWGTLMLIAGGLVMGRALEQAGCIASFAGMVDWPALPPTERLAMLVLASATLSALLSNTATATILIPVGLAVLPGPATPVMIALGCSLGAPFVISTPPNAMVHGEGGITAGDLLWPGMLLLLGGGALLVLSGPRTLGIFGLS